MAKEQDKHSRNAVETRSSPFQCVLVNTVLIEITPVNCRVSLIKVGLWNTC